MMPRAPDAGSTVSWALGLSRRHVVIRRTPFASVWQACGCLSHRRDRPTYPEPSERLLAVTASEHPIGATGGLEFGIVAILVQHQMRGAVDVQVREHRVFLRYQTIRTRKVAWAKDE